MTIDPESLYLQLGQLVAEMPKLDGTDPITPDINRWLGRAALLVEATGARADALRLKTLSDFLNTKLRDMNVSGQQRHLDLRRCRKYCGHHENCGYKYQYDSAAIPSTAQRATQRANVAGVQRAWGVGRRDRATSRVERECVALLEGAAARGKASKVAQAQMAEKLGITQANVSRIESRSDMMLSILSFYARAVDAQVEILVRIRHDVFQLRREESRGLKHGFKVVASMIPNR